MVTEFTVVGDASLDVVVAQSVARCEGSDVPATIRIGPGGQGANVAVRLARQGARARLIAPMADDAAGRLLRDALLADGVSLRPVPVPASTIVLVMLDESGERTMISDRQTLNVDAVATELEGATWTHCSGYPLLDDATGDRLAEILGSRSGSVRLSIAGGSVSPDPVRVARLRQRIAASRPDVLLVSASEAEPLLGVRPTSGLASARSLGDLAPVVLVTSGAAGSAAIADETEIEVEAHHRAKPMVDATGAGDAFLAASLLELASGEWPPKAATLRRAMERGSLLGAQVARVVGAQTWVAAEGAAG